MEIVEGVCLFDRNTEDYRRFECAISGMSPLVSVDGLSPQEVNAVIKGVLTDHPELFWFSGKWELKSADTQFYAAPQYLFGREEAAAIARDLRDIASEIIADAAEQRSRIQAIRFLYDWLLDHVEYGFGRSLGQTSYDALIGRKAVCKGLSKALQLLLNGIGVSSTLREGTLDGQAKHVWNLVELDGKRYNVDVSLGYDRFSYLFPPEEEKNRYRCFLIPEEAIKRTHSFRFQVR